MRTIFRQVFALRRRLGEFSHNNSNRVINKFADLTTYYVDFEMCTVRIIVFRCFSCHLYQFCFLSNRIIYFGYTNMFINIQIPSTEMYFSGYLFHFLSSIKVLFGYKIIGMKIII